MTSQALAVASSIAGGNAGTISWAAGIFTETGERELIASGDGIALVSPPPRCAAHYQHAIWLYLRFTLSYRDVEELIHHLWSTSASSRLGRCTVTFNVWKDRGEEQAASFSRQAARLAARSGAAQEPGW
jgi:hypothetical protein